jgi:hypothetical protein
MVDIVKKRAVQFLLLLRICCPDSRYASYRGLIQTMPKIGELLLAKVYHYRSQLEHALKNNRTRRQTGFNMIHGVYFGARYR